MWVPKYGLLKKKDPRGKVIFRQKKQLKDIVEKNGQLALNSNYILTHYLSIKFARCRTTNQITIPLLLPFTVRENVKKSRMDTGTIGYTKHRMKTSNTNSTTQKIKIWATRTPPENPCGREVNLALFSLYSVYISGILPGLSRQVIMMNLQWYICVPDIRQTSTL